MVLKICPHCNSVNITDENSDSFYCSKCGKRISLDTAEKRTSRWDYKDESEQDSKVPAEIKKAFNVLFSGDMNSAHELFQIELDKDDNNIYALLGESVCAPRGRRSYFSRLSNHSKEITIEEKTIINKSNSKIFSKLFCEFDDEPRMKYMTSKFPYSISIDLLTKDCYKNRNLNIVSVLLAGYISAIEIFNKFMEFAYTTNSLYSSFDSKYLRPTDLAQLISAGLSTNDKIITLKEYGTVENSTSVNEIKVSINDFFKKYFNGVCSTAEGSIISDFYRFYGSTYYDYSTLKRSINVTAESYLNIIQNYKLKSKYKDVKEYNCYIARSVFGSYDCPELYVLRRFRDKKLYIERSFLPYIDLYYKISPMFINLFEKSNSFQNFAKIFLTKLINFLKVKDYEDTPYTDFI